MSFDRLAPHYRWMEQVLAGEKLQRCRAAHLDAVHTAERVLLAGEGHGRFLVRLRQALPRAHIVCLDASQRMLHCARHQLRRAGLSDEKVQFVHADVRHGLASQEPFDLIATHFFLDCFPEGQLADVVSHLSETAADRAGWLLADFREADGGLARVRTRLILGIMYLFFRVATRLPATRLANPDPLLERAGFRLRRRQVTEWGLLHSDWWERQRS